MAGEGTRRSARAVQAREREAEAVALRKLGQSYGTIGKALGVSDVAARKMVKRALLRLEKLTAEASVEVRRLELERLDRALSPALWAKVDQADTQAVKTLLDIQARRAAYLGLDAPKKTELTGKDGGLLAVGFTLEDAVEADRKLGEWQRGKEAGGGADADAQGRGETADGGSPQV